ncbi:MAG: 4,5-DOPA dioxygenase extradiol [Pyrinomonadaceae bacterium]
MMTSTAMPAIFFGHGNPLNALAQNYYTAAWAAIGASIQKPRAILCISAHWYLPGTAVTAMPQPRTIHDFGGFPAELYQVHYPAPGDPVLAQQVRDLLAPVPVRLDQEWGLDHGTWSVLVHAFPDADVPVVQWSIDESQPAAFHYEMGKRLGPLRDEGVLIVGSGNLVHNLHAYAWGRHPVEPLDWAVRFEEQARAFILAGSDQSLVDYESLGPDALLSAPTPDHYLPLLYILGTRRPDDKVMFPVAGFDGGSISMLSVQLE